MDANPWLSDPTAGNTGSDRSADEQDGRQDGLGNQITNALGDFDAKLTQLHEDLESKRSELADLEDLIAETEKAQAKAFKELLSKNPQIKKMLGQQKKKTTRRRKPKAETKPAADETPPSGQMPPDPF